MANKKKKIEKKRIINIEPYGVDLVDTPAIKKRFLVIKRDTSSGIILEDDAVSVVKKPNEVLVLVMKKRDEIDDSDLIVISKEAQDKEADEDVQNKEEDKEDHKEKTLLERLTGFTLDYSDDISQEVRDNLAAAISVMTKEKPGEKEEEGEKEEPEQTKTKDIVSEESKDKPNQPVPQTDKAGETKTVDDSLESDNSDEPTEKEITEYLELKVEEEVGVLSAQ